jgi:hypothetical protein
MRPAKRRVCRKGMTANQIVGLGEIMIDFECNCTLGPAMGVIQYMPIKNNKWTGTAVAGDSQGVAKGSGGSSERTLQQGPSTFVGIDFGVWTVETFFLYCHSSIDE